MMPPASVRIGITVDFIPTDKPAMMLVACPVDDCRTIDSRGVLPIAVKYSVTTLMIAPTTVPTTMAAKTPFRLKLVVGSVLSPAGSSHITTKYEATTVNNIEDQFPRFNAF